MRHARAMRAAVTPHGLMQPMATHSPKADTSWGPCLQAIQDARRLVQHHAGVVEAQLHALVQAVLPAVDALRSQTAKDALALLQVNLPPHVWVLCLLHMPLCHHR